MGILTTEIYNGFESRRSMSCLFLNIHGAFDNVVSSILIDDLARMGLPPKICWFVCQLINQRSIQFVNNGEISPVYVASKGVPQGSILSPLLFNLYVAECGRSLTDGCRIIQFADDMTVYADSTDIQDSLRVVERSANRLSRFLLARGLSVSPAKSALIVFSRKRIGSRNFTIILDGVGVNSACSHRFLGVLLDPTLRGRDQARYLVKKCGRLANVLRSLCGVWWGADPRTLLSVFKALVRGSIEYGALIFPIHNKSLIELLERTQRRVLRYCMGLRQTTPINAIYAETGIGPIRQRFEYLKSKFVLKSFVLKDSVLIDKLCDLQAALFNNNRFDLYNRFPLYRAFCKVRKYRHRIAFFSRLPLYLFSYETSSFAPRVEITPQSVVENIRHAPFPQLVFQASLSHLIVERQLIFTDASKEEFGDYVGIGIFCPNPHIRKKFRSDGCSSVFSGECITIIHAVEFILEDCVERATVLTDFRSVVDVVSNNRIDRDHNYLVLALKNKLGSASLQGLDVVLAWIPAHDGIPGNETADRLAKEAIGEGVSLGYLPPTRIFTPFRARSTLRPLEAYSQAKQLIRAPNILIFILHFPPILGLPNRV